jgi:hypothetical protein
MPEIPNDVPAIGGRGLSILDQVADDWGGSARLTGQVVWAESDRNQRGGPREPIDDRGDA